MLQIFLVIWTFCGLIPKNMGINCSSVLHSQQHSSGICYWVIVTTQERTQGVGKCVDSGGYPALIPDNSHLQTVNDLISNEGITSEVYIGYNVDTSTANGYIVTTLSDSTQSWAPFYSQNILSADWSCVSVYLGNFWPERCDKIYNILCADAVNIGVTSVTSTSSSSTSMTSNVILDTSTVITSSSAPPGSCDCVAHCSVTTYTQPLTSNMTDELNSKIEKMTNELKVEKRELSSSVRKKTSAPDSRPSATRLGCLGIVMMTFVFGGIVLMDIQVIVASLKELFKTIRLFCK